MSFGGLIPRVALLAWRPMSWLFPTDPERQRRRDRWLVILLGLLIVVLAARAARKHDGVLLRNQEFGARVLAGEDPYFDPARGHRVHGPYPPSYALVTVPLALVPTPLARVGWALAQGAALIAAFRWLTALARRHAPRSAEHAPVWCALALLLVSRFLLRDTSGGGGNVIYATLVLGALIAAESGRAARSGWLFALPLVLKPNLAPLALFFVATRRWRVLAATTLAALALWALPAPFYGLREWWSTSARWASDVYAFSTLDDLHADERVPDGLPKNDSSMNQSLRAALDRLLRPSASERIDDVHVAEVEPATIAWLARGVGVGLLASLTFAAWRARTARARWWAALGFLPACLLVAPIAWKAHHVALLPLCFGLVGAAHVARRPAWGVGLALYWLLANVASEEVLGKGAKNWLQAVSLITWFDVVLVAIAVVLALRDREPAADETRAHDALRPA